MSLRSDNYSEYKIWKGVRKRCLNEKSPAYKNYGGRGINVCLGFFDFSNFFKCIGKRPTPKHCVDRIDNSKHYSCGVCTQCIEYGWTMNLRWVTNKENCRNTRKNKLVTWNGETHTIAEWVEITGIKNIGRRLRDGWDLERTMTLPDDMIGNQPHTLPKELHALIIRKYNTNFSIANISELVDFGQDAVKKVLVSNHIKIRSQGEQQKLITTKTSRLITFNGKTMTAAQWARETGISSGTLRLRLDREGWSVEKALTTPVRKWPSQQTNSEE